MSIIGVDIGSIVSGVGQLADDLFTSDEERLKIQLEVEQMNTDRLMGQMKVNQAEARHKSLFVAGWRPAIGWCGALALGYQFLGYPLLLWGWDILQAYEILPCHLGIAQSAMLTPCSVMPPPPLPADQLWVVVSGMLGIAGMRSFDKVKGTHTDKI